MASLSDRVARLLRNPQAKQLAARAQQLARDPRTRRKLDELRTRLTKKQ